MPPVIETPRLALREMSMADLDFVAAMLADPDVMRFYPKCYSRAEAVAWIERQLERYTRYGYGLWLAVDRAARRPVGQIGVVRSRVDSGKEPALTYLVHRPFWRRGYATEGVAASRDYVFENLGQARVITLIRPENIPSQGVALKIGMRAERRTQYRGFEHIVFAATRRTVGGPGGARRSSA